MKNTTSFACGQFPVAEQEVRQYTYHNVICTLLCCQISGAQYDGMGGGDTRCPCGGPTYTWGPPVDRAVVRLLERRANGYMCQKDCWGTAAVEEGCMLMHPKRTAGERNRGISMLMHARRTAGEKETQLQLRRDAHACQEDCLGELTAAVEEGCSCMPGGLLGSPRVEEGCSCVPGGLLGSLRHSCS